MESGDLESFDLELHQRQKDKNAFRSLFVSPTGYSQSLTNGSSLFNIRVKAKQSVRDLSEVLQLDNQILESAFYSESGSETKVDLEFAPIEKSKDKYLQPAIEKYYSNEIQAYPNPFDDLLNIKFLAETESDHVIVIRNLDGREVWSDKIYLQKGVNIFNIPIAESLSTGVFLVSIEANDGSMKYGKIVKVK